MAPLDYSFSFFTAKFKHALDHQLYSSALKGQKLLTTLLHLSDLNPPTDITLACLISMTLTAHSDSANSTDWCRTTSNTPSTCPKDFSTLPLNLNPRAVLLCLLSSTNNGSCFRLFVLIFAVKARCFVVSVIKLCHCLDDRYGGSCLGLQVVLIIKQRNHLGIYILPFC